MSDKTCPDCSRPMRLIKKPGEYEFWGCSGYPVCRHTEEVEDPHAPECPDCGVKMQKRRGSKGEFYGCPNYPSCKKTAQVGGKEKKPNAK